jgi:hypothetical protein
MTPRQSGKSGQFTMLSTGRCNLGLVCLAAFVVGCHTETRPENPPMPLLASKKPVEPKPDQKDATLGMEEPTLPVPPASALASLPPEFEKYVRFVKRSTVAPSGDTEPNTPTLVPRPSPNSNSP